MAVLLLAGEAFGLSFDDVLIDGTVGSGANETMVVIDWETGTTPSHAWRFQWDDGPLPYVYADAFDALMADVTGFSWSQTAFVTYVNYDEGSENHVTETGNWLSFWQSGDGENWLDTQLGVFQQPLVNGGWVGVNANLPQIWPGDSPWVPLAVPVPEPSPEALFALSTLGLSARGRFGRGVQRRA
jgi:hypothetical protein